jgi:hypothetical protein
MITALLLTIILTFFNFIFGLLSGVLVWTGVSTAFVDLINYTYQFNSILPIDTALQVLKYTTDFWILVFTWDFLKMLLHLIRGN